MFKHVFSSATLHWNKMVCKSPTHRRRKQGSNSSGGGVAWTLPAQPIFRPLIFLYAASIPSLDFPEGPTKMKFVKHSFNPTFPITHPVTIHSSLRHIPGTSLVVQWLRICLPMQGTRVRALVWEDPTCRGATRPVSHNYWACASGACAPPQERPR